MPALRPSLATLVLAGTLGMAHAAPSGISLTLSERGHVARQHEPAVASIPFPRGALKRPEGLWIASAEGGRLPSQATVLERWPEGSVRWVLVDFLTSTPADGATNAVVHLDGAKGPPPKSAITTTRAGNRVTLTNGVLTATFRPATAHLVDDLRVAGRALGAIDVPHLLTAESRTAGAPTVTSVRVETEGAIRTEVLLEGSYPDGVTFEARVALFAGRPEIRVAFTIINTSDASDLAIRGLPLRVPLSVRRGALGVDTHARPFDTIDRAHTLAHGDTPPPAIDGTPFNEGDAAWALAVSDDIAVMLSPRWFREEWSKALTLDRDHVALDLFPDLGGPTRLGIGAAKTHEAWIIVTPAASPPSPTDAAARRSPLVATASARTIVASGALPQALDAEAPAHQAFLGQLREAVARYQARARHERWDDGDGDDCATRQHERVRLGFFGALNWGDWNFPGYRDGTKGCDAWGNLEYDLPQVLGLGWFATGDARWWDEFNAAARHYRDVDIIHRAPSHPEWRGMNHPHKVRHFGREAGATIDLGHTWAEGLVTHWRATGEHRSLAAARGIADALVSKVGKAKNPRQYGWPMLVLAAVHQATDDQRYRAAATAYAHAATRAFEPTPAAGDWKMGVMADGIAAVHAMTQDDALRTWLARYAEAFAAEPARWPDPRYALALAYLSRITGTTRWADLARSTVTSLEIGTWGKTLASEGRIGFRILSELQGPAPKAATPARVAPPPASPRARRPR